MSSPEYCDEVWAKSPSPRKPKPTSNSSATARSARANSRSTAAPVTDDPLGLMASQTIAAPTETTVKEVNSPVGATPTSPHHDLATPASPERNRRLAAWGSPTSTAAALASPHPTQARSDAEASDNDDGEASPFGAATWAGFPTIAAGPSSSSAVPQSSTTSTGADNHPWGSPSSAASPVSQFPAYLHNQHLRDDDDNSPTNHAGPLASSAASPTEQSGGCPYEITVSDPRKESDGTAHAHISYLVTSLKALPGTNRRNKTALRRRYQDFVWLHANLAKDYPACALPPLPGKYRMEYLTGDRFSDDFIGKRRAGLERFLGRLAHHPVLRASHYFIVFLEARDWSSEYEEKAKADGGVLDNLGDAFLNAFSKIKKRDEKFIEIQETVDKLEENLTAVEKLYSRIGKRETEAAEAYAELGRGLNDLGQLETGLTAPLTAAGATVVDFSDHLKSLTGGIDATYLSQVHEYIAYSQCFKAILKLRDQKQVEFEELSYYLQTTTAELERILQNQHASLTSGAGFTSYLKGKYREMKGVDHEQLRRERIEKLERKVKELQSAVELSHDETTKCSNIVTKELDIFQDIKTADFKQHLGDLATYQVDFYDKAMSTWETLLPILEGIELDE
ncbi:intercellular trafficking and secretion [Tieghemiomyces parasiticus]|uniref:Sorting nexin-4 n=1 Tax=Tieghemiomyces parasiticus TaxID=78921 RepID=A0A9W8DZ84_9FUNG|nr:intercellular trafficking and secretion [Tieghemiomyces parasiticus]